MALFGIFFDSTVIYQRHYGCREGKIRRASIEHPGNQSRITSDHP